MIRWLIVTEILKDRSKDYIDLVNFIDNTFNEKRISYQIVEKNKVKELDLSNFDKAIFWCDDTDVLKYLEDNKVKVLNDYKSTIITNNKIKQLKELDKYNLIPKLYNVTDIIEAKELSYPKMLKLPNSVLGSGVFKIDSYNELLNYKELLKKEEYILQDYIENDNKIIKVFCINNKIISSYKKDDNKLIKVELTSKDKEKIIKTIEVLSLDYGSVDLLETNENDRIICEVNLVFNINNVYRATNINVIEKIIEEY